ncbi:MAG: hypothetical protein R3C53_16340 [Pirellulaceae bacterium]
MKVLTQFVFTLRRILRRNSPSTRRIRRSGHVRRCSERESDGGVFRFAPELFETRTDVIAELAERGFDWLSHYSSVDPIHDCYGIEVCGIHDQHDAAAILDILIELFPDWRPG